MMLAVAFSLALGAFARAEAPVVFAQDPLCSSPDFFSKDYEQVSAVHRKFAQLRPAFEVQQKWFTTVSSTMSSNCSADAKFAAHLLAEKHDELTGQCKPAEEAALTDQEVLDRSEGALKIVEAQRNALFARGENGAADPLTVIAMQDTKLVRDYAYTLEEVPFEAFCELKWTYPEAYWKTLGDSISGCPALKAFDQPSDEDKKNPSLFARLKTRFELSLSYNTTRRNNAAATAIASRARYQSCVAQFPDLSPNPILTAKGISGKPAATPQGKSPSKGSDITGTDQEKKKQDQLP